MSDTRIYTRRLRLILRRLSLTIIALAVLAGCGGPELASWHTEQLSGEFSVSGASDIDTLEAYLKLEEALFAQLQELVYDDTGTGPEYALMRYSSGSRADPGQRLRNWNRSFELGNESPAGGVLLLHGMSDSPYSLRALGQKLQQHGFQVLGLRMPGHGTAPSGLTQISWRDMSAATRMGMQYLARRVGDKSVHIIGYSTGAALALDYALLAEQTPTLPPPASLVLVSPAIGISPAAVLAQWSRRLSLLPGLGHLAWLSIAPEFDPYKYNSFATNAAEQVRDLTNSVASRIAARDSKEKLLPPILAIKSTVDATVSTNAVVDRLLSRLAPNRHELLLFDINRYAASSSLLVEDPAPLTARMIRDEHLSFGMTLVTNTDPTSRAVTAFYKAPLSAGVARTEPLAHDWPQGVFSLSHVALPFPPDDPLYGETPPVDRKLLFLGSQALQGERGVLMIPDDFMFRLRHNPFYDYLEQRAVSWIEGKPGN